jgi:Pyruvate phosphate dikinase, AMP/ATP-binding domain
MPGPATSTPLVVPLDQAAGLGLGADRIGSKAANLAQLVAAGFPIPPAFVIPADAFADWPQVQAVLPAVVSALGDGPLAVRSSAAAEDLAGASYAGLYESFLDVGRDQFADAVRRCWASATSQRVTTYQHHHQQPQDRPAMAVLVQRMVHPDAAGVPSPPTRSPAPATRSWSAPSAAWVSGWWPARPAATSGLSATARPPASAQPYEPSTPTRPWRWPPWPAGSSNTSASPRTWSG